MEGGRGRSKFQNERGGGGYPSTYGEFKRARANEGYNVGPHNNHRRNNYRDRGQYEPPGKRPRHWDHDDRRGGGGERGRGGHDQSGFQPVMMTFKAFLVNQDDTITDEDAMTKYGEYKAEFKRQQLNEFFVSHKVEEWFRERFHPVEKENVKKVAVEGRNRRAQVFWELFDRVNQVRLDGTMQEDLVTLMDIIVIKLEGGSEDHIRAYLEKESDVEEQKITQPTVKTSLEKDKIEENVFENEESQSDTGEIIDQENSVDDTKVSIGNGNDTKVSNESSNDTKSSEANIEDDLELSGDEPLSDELGEDVPQTDGNDTLNKEAQGIVLDNADVDDDCIPCLEGGDLAALVDEEDRIDSAPLETSDVTTFASTSTVPQLDGAQDDVDLRNDIVVDPSSVAPPVTTPEPLEAQKPTRKNLHSTTSLHLRNIPATITKAELEAVCSKYEGFLRVALSDPTPDRKWSRRGWITFAKGSNVKEICCSLSEVRLGGTELGPVINRELSKRVRLVGGIVNDRKIVRNDIKLASKIIQNMDLKWDLAKDVGGGKLLENIADYLIEEASAEEDELLGVTRDEGEEPGGMVMVTRDEELMGVLDRMIMYLRVVHSVDFYNHSEYPYEDQMPNRLGLIHARGPLPKDKVAQSEIEQYVENFEKKIGGFLTNKEDLTDKEVQVLGCKSEEEEVEKFIQLNSQELSKDKWLCPLSGKKFKGPEFIRKHIMSKFMESVEQVKSEVQYFNNYLKDPKRPQLPEQPKLVRPSGGRKNEDDRPGSGGGYREATSYPVYNERGKGVWDRPPPNHFRGGHRGWGGGGHNVRERVGYNMRGGGGGRDYDRPDPRSVIDYSDVDPPMDW